MSIWEAIIQGIIQGLTEFLPVSSSGHVSIAQHFLGLNGKGAQAYTMFLHFGTLIAVFIVYRRIIWDLIVEFCLMVRDLALDLYDRVTKGAGKYKRRFSWKLGEMEDIRRMVIFVIAACACAVILFLPLFGFLGLRLADGEKVRTLADISEYTSEDASILLEGLCLLVTGFLLIYATKLAKRRVRAGGGDGSRTDGSDGKMTMAAAVLMGVAQCVAALPGLSRSGTTTTTGMIKGVEKNKALEFSFIIGIPAVLASNVLEVAKMSDSDWDRFQTGPVLVGVLFSAVVGILAIAGLRWIVTNDKLHYFGYYCLVVGSVVILVAIIESLTGCGGSSEKATDLLQLVSASDTAARTVSGADAVSIADAVGAIVRAF